MSAPTFITGRGAINPWECDQWGHLTVQFYLAKASDAQAHLAARLGLVPSRLRSAAGSLMPSTDRALFKRELRAGDIYFIRSGIRALTADGTLATILSRYGFSESDVPRDVTVDRLCTEA